MSHFQHVQSKYTSSITRVHLQVELYIVANTVVLQSKLVLERSLSLPLEKYFVGLAADHGRDNDLEVLCQLVSIGLC